MEDVKEKGYPVYASDELDLIQQVASGSECTGLMATPPRSAGEAESYSALYNVPNLAESAPPSTGAGGKKGKKGIKPM